MDCGLVSDVLWRLGVEAAVNRSHRAAVGGEVCREADLTHGGPGVRWITFYQPRPPGNEAEPRRAVVVRLLRL